MIGVSGQQRFEGRAQVSRLGNPRRPVPLLALGVEDEGRRQRHDGKLACGSRIGVHIDLDVSYVTHIGAHLVDHPPNPRAGSAPDRAEVHDGGFLLAKEAHEVIGADGVTSDERDAIAKSHAAKFGLVGVNFANQNRYVRPSARWLAEVIRKRSL